MTAHDIHHFQVSYYVYYISFLLSMLLHDCAEGGSETVQSRLSATKWSLLQQD